MSKGGEEFNNLKILSVEVEIVGGVGCAACNAQDSRVELYY